MKKLFFCLFAIALSFTSYTYAQKKDTTSRDILEDVRTYLIKNNTKDNSHRRQPQKEDTTYFTNKNIKYSKVKIFQQDGRVLYIIQNIDEKYKGDKMNLYGGVSEESYKTIDDYYKSVNNKIKNEVKAIWFKYIKENFTVQEKRRILDILKKYHVIESPKSARISFYVFINLDGSTSSFRFFTDGTYKDEDIANLDLLIRENLILESSGLSTQRSNTYGGNIDRNQYIEFLEKELQGVK